MYFVSDAGGHGTHIWRQRFPDGEIQQVTSGPTEEDGIAMASDGRSFITAVGAEESAVWVHDSGGDRQVSSEGYAYDSELSHDGTKVFYLVSATAAHWGHGGELWMSDLHSGQATRVLPGIAVENFSISPDGKRIVYESSDEKGKRRLWLASIDRRFAPRQITSNPGESSPQYVPSGKVYFQAAEGDSNYMYRMNDDGSQREKVISTPVIGFAVASPDERFVVALRATSGEDNSVAVDALPLAGGPAVRLGSDKSEASWSDDGRALYFNLPSMKSVSGRKTYIIPLAHGEDFPPLPAKGVQQETDIPNHASLQVVEEAINPGPNPSLYSFSRKSVHRNLYRVPIQ
jgi:WD40 repeat protein